MPRGGARPGAGRKPKPKLPFANKAEAHSVLSKLGTEYKGRQLPTKEDIWLGLILSSDQRIRLDSMKYLTNRDEGEPVHTVNHLHDKPIDLNVNLSMAEVIKEVRHRKQEYERSRK